MPRKMSKKEEKAWKKKLGKKIYEKEFNKAKAKAVKERRTRRIAEIKESARQAAKKKYGMSRSERIKSNLSKASKAYKEGRYIWEDKEIGSLLPGRPEEKETQSLHSAPNGV